MTLKPILRYMLILITLIVGSTAVHGGYGLITGGISLPESLLEGSPFTSFVMPGFILLFIVGGTHFLAAFSIWRNYRFFPEVTAIAAFGLLIWIFTEQYMIHHSMWLQIVYFGLALTMLVITYGIVRLSVHD